MKALSDPTGRRGALRIRNHQRGCRLDLGLLRRIVQTLLDDILGRGDTQLDIHLVGATRITRLNEIYARHRGVTDVLAFDYTDSPDGPLRGEVFVCLPVAFAQARRFHTTWQSELVRYLAHALLHLGGHDDRTATGRRKMKRAEDAALLKLSARYPFKKLAGPTTGRRSRGTNRPAPLRHGRLCLSKPGRAPRLSE